MTDYTQAACLGQDPELWFEQGGTRGRRAALRTCNGAPAKDGRPPTPPCPIREQCLRDTLLAEGLCDSGYLFGVAGGLTAQQRGRLVQMMCQRCRVEPRAGVRYCRPCQAIAKSEYRVKAEANRGAA